MIDDMPETLTQSYLERNLGCLGPANRDFAEAVRRAPAAAVQWEEAADGAATGMLEGRRLASRHRPLEEGERLAQSVDIVEHAVVVVLGFGIGHHVAALARRMDRSGVLVVFEPDLSLIRAVFERMDFSEWLSGAIIVWMHDASDRAAIARKLSGADAIVAQGVAILEHPAHRARLGKQSSQFTTLFGEFVNASKTTLMTTLVRSQNTIENLLNNLDHYVLAPGIVDLKDAAKGHLAVVVSAGPSLRKNLHLLAQPGVRNRCVIIAVQTTLKPLLEAGIRPHFVTALDYHAISKRFYEGLTPEMVEGVTLIAEPKAHPVILDSFPGPIRCVGSGFLDKALGPLARDMGHVPAGATVAHLAFYLARYLGCDPIAFIGQDLGFTDGLYYARGTAIHDIWSPELNPFNTIEMMEWQRIARHRTHLHKTVDHEGKSIFTDAQMLTYLQQFERDFAEAVDEGATLIDASEGGVKKQHTTIRTLAETLAKFAETPLPELPVPEVARNESALAKSQKRIAAMRRDIASLQATSRKTAALLREMLADQQDNAKMDRHFAKMETYRAAVEKLFDAFELLNMLNQLGVFRRHRSDRRLQLSANLSSLERQRAQLERDLDNVTWLIDAADELIGLFTRAERLLAGEATTGTAESEANDGEASKANVDSDATQATRTISAIVPIDPARNGRDLPRSLSAMFAGRNVLQATLERLGRARRIDTIILIVPESFEIESLIDQSRIGRPVVIERVPAGPFAPEHEAIAIARRWAPESWRGGIAGIAGLDEALAPQAMRQVMDRHGLDAAIIVAPDWPLIDVSKTSGVDAMIVRFNEQPDRHGLVFSQSPPGLGACLISRTLMTEFSERNRLSTVGGVLTYQPHAPQHDPIARDANITIEHRVRCSLVRAAADSPEAIARLEEAIRAAGISNPSDASTEVIVDAVERHAPPLRLPQHVMLELNTRRADHGLYARSLRATADRPDLDPEVAFRLFDQLAHNGDHVITLAGVGDPLLHPAFDAIIARANDRGLPVHVRTSLFADRSTIERLMNAQPAVISIDLHADRGATHAVMMGEDRLREVIAHIEWMMGRRRRLTAQEGSAAFALPWIVPRLQRRRETYEDIDSFFDRWMAVLGAAVIEGPPPFEDRDDDLAIAMAPERVMWRELQRRMLVLSDGSVPISELDLDGRVIVGSIARDEVASLWSTLLTERRTLREYEGERCEGLRTVWP